MLTLSKISKSSLQQLNRQLSLLEGYGELQNFDNYLEKVIDFGKSIHGFGKVLCGKIWVPTTSKYTTKLP